MLSSFADNHMRLSKMLDNDCTLSSVYLSVCLSKWDFAVHMCVFFSVFVLISALLVIRVTSQSDSGHTA